MGNIYEVCGAWKENQQRSQIMQDVENKIYVFFFKNENLRQRKVVEKLPQYQKTANCCCCYYCHLIENTMALASHNNSDTIKLQYTIQNNTYVLFVFFQYG